MELSQNKNTKDYASLLLEIKQQVKQSQLKAVISANSQMLYMYWYIGNNILQMQKEQGWGAKVIDQLSKDLRTEFPDQKGFSVRNLKYMQKFAEEYSIEFMQQLAAQSLVLEHNIKVQQPAAQLEDLFMQTPVAQIPWFHHCILMDKIKKIDERLWYINQTVENGWSRNVLAMQIESDLYKRQVTTKKITNFKSTLPSVQSDFAEQILKDPYIFDFVTIKGKADEKNIEDQLCSHITKFLLELGQGFSFIGRQYHLNVGNKDFYIDLLFYHIRLRCYVVVELKAVPFSPEQTGQLNFYVNVVDDVLKTEQDNPTIGLLLCKSKNEAVAEYALGGIKTPLGVADFEFSKAIPEELKTTLPSIEDLEKELEGMDNDEGRI